MPSISRMTIPDRSIFVVNHSKLISDAQAQLMTDACNLQIGHDFAPAWGIQPMAVHLVRAGEKLPVGAWVISLADTMDEPDAAGYHTVDGKGLVSGVIGVKVCMDNGSKPLQGAFSVASVLSHECLELAADPFCASWCDTGRGLMVCAEACDPVQSDYYRMAGTSVDVSSFVTPQWFNASAPTGMSLDALGSLKKPFTMTQGGYWVQMAEGKVTQRFGAELPQWVRDRKESPYSRAGQRLRNLPGQSIVV
jgi:hypothetical protein